jgi:flavin-dependent dehydrogenase
MFRETEMSQPIKIMGAGPAGLAAAITLAQNNHDVVVYEKKRDCGARFRGDLQGLENWSAKTDIMSELAAMGLQINFDCTPFDTLHAFSAKRETTTFRADRPLFYLVKRGARPGTLDDGLKRQAVEMGVQIKFNASVAEEEVDIVACGPNSQAIYAIDTGIIFETDLPDVAYGMLNNENAYLGYSYLLVTGGYGCMCTVLFDRYRDIHRQFASVKQTFVELTGVTIKNPTRVGGFGSFTHRPQFVREGRYYIGEAAGLQDLLWGFGIRYALRSGHLAARCLMGRTDYTQAAHQTFANSLRASVVNRFLWERMGNRGYSFFLRLGKRSKDPRQFLFNFFSYSQLRRLAFPLALWDLRRRHRPLPY